MLIHINRVSEFFFLLLGTAYLFAFLSWKNNFYPFLSELFLRLADTPLALFAILFGVSSFSLSLHIQSDDSQNAPMDTKDIVLLVIAALLILIIAGIDIFVPTRAPLPLLS